MWRDVLFLHTPSSAHLGLFTGRPFRPIALQRSQRSFLLAHSPSMSAILAQAKVLSGTVDNSDSTFLDDDQKAAGFVLTCTSYIKSDAVLQTHAEEDLF